MFNWFLYLYIDYYL